MPDDGEGPTTWDVPSLDQLQEWAAEREAAATAAGPERPPVGDAPNPTPPAPAPHIGPTASSAVGQPVPVNAPPAAPVASGEAGALTDWMSPQELEAAMSSTEAQARPRTTASPRPYRRAPERPAWLLPVIAIAAFVMLLGSVGLVILLAS